MAGRQVLSLFSHTQLCDSMDCSLLGSSVHEFSRQEYWCGLPFPPPGDLPDPEIKPASLASPALAGRFFTTHSNREALTLPYLRVLFTIAIFYSRNTLSSSCSRTLDQLLSHLTAVTLYKLWASHTSGLNSQGLPREALSLPVILSYWSIVDGQHYLRYRCTI